MPDCLLDHILSAIPKKEPWTHRLIVVMASMLRIFLGVLTRKFVRPWDSVTASDTDTARPGARAEIMVGLRHALQAAALTRKEQTATVLWDLEAFYDNVDIPTLIGECQRYDFPMPVLILALQCHMAPRRIRHTDKISRAIYPSRGILAGCSTSTSLARAQLRSTQEPQIVDTYQHVDDAAMLATALTETELVDKLRDAIVTFAGQVKRLRLTVSHPKKGARPKTKVISSSSRVAQQLVHILKLHKVTAEHVFDADDLGISTGAGKRRSMKTMSKRGSK